MKLSNLSDCIPNFNIQLSLSEDDEERRDVNGGRCMQGSDGRLSFSAKDGGSVWTLERTHGEDNE